MNLQQTRISLRQTIKKLLAMRKDMIARNEIRKNEFLMLLEVIMQCLIHLQVLNAFCQKGEAYIEQHRLIAARADQQAVEYVNLVASV
jgi:Flp pilus assembly CpaF family ATPase